MTSNFFVRVGVETLMTPVTYLIVGFLKRAEREDFYDGGRTSTRSPCRREDFGGTLSIRTRRRTLAGEAAR
jgi:hypothetical protein